MDYRTIDPPAALTHVVRFFWTLEGGVQGRAPHRLIAETCPNLVFICRGRFIEADGRPAPPAHLAGAIDAFADNVACGPFSLFGAYLWPWSVQALFGLRPEACFNTFTGLDVLWGAEGSDLEARMCAAPDHAQRADLLTAALQRRMVDGTDAPMEAIVQRILEEQGRMPMDEVIAGSGTGRRQFERRFKACTGFSPALFARILRAQRTYRMLERGEAASLTELAHACGYFDQSHFIRDFKRFSGLNPRDYFVKASEKADNFLQLPG